MATRGEGKPSPQMYVEMNARHAARAGMPMHMCPYSHPLSRGWWLAAYEQAKQDDMFQVELEEAECEFSPLI